MSPVQGVPPIDGYGAVAVRDHEVWFYGADIAGLAADPGYNANRCQLSTTSAFNAVACTAAVLTLSVTPARAQSSSRVEGAVHTTLADVDPSFALSDDEAPTFVRLAEPRVEGDGQLIGGQLTLRLVHEHVRFSLVLGYSSPAGSRMRWAHLHRTPYSPCRAAAPQVAIPTSLRCEWLATWTTAMPANTCASHNVPPGGSHDARRGSRPVCRFASNRIQCRGSSGVVGADTRHVLSACLPERCGIAAP